MPKINWFYKLRFEFGAFITLLLTLAVSFAIYANLTNMENNRIAEYEYLGKGLSDLANGYSRDSKYRDLNALMRTIAKTTYIQYTALFNDGELILQEGDSAGLEPALLERMRTPVLSAIKKSSFLYLNLPLVGNPELNHRKNQVLQIVFSLKDFQERKQNILLAMGVIVLLLAGLLFLLYLLSLYRTRIEKTQEALRQEGETQSEMIQIISHHSMKNLTAIYGTLHLMRNTKGSLSSFESRDNLQAILENTDAIKRSLENLKDNERLKKGMVKSLPQDVELNQLIDMIHRSFEPVLKKKRVKLRVQIGKTPLRIWADPEIIKTILMNLLDNALKYSSDRSEIKIKVVRKKDCFEIWVQDQGTGIQEADWERIFTPFVRLNPRIQGTGLGLSNSRQLARLLAGDLSVRASQLNKGTTFCVTLPRRTGNHATQV